MTVVSSMDLPFPFHFLSRYHEVFRSYRSGHMAAANNVFLLHGCWQFLLTELIHICYQWVSDLYPWESRGGRVWCRTIGLYRGKAGDSVALGKAYLNSRPLSIWTFLTCRCARRGSIHTCSLKHWTNTTCKLFQFHDPSKQVSMYWHRNYCAMYMILIVSHFITVFRLLELILHNSEIDVNQFTTGIS